MTRCRTASCTAAMIFAAWGASVAVSIPQGEPTPRPIATTDPAVAERLRRFREESAQDGPARTSPPPSIRPAHLYSDATGPVEVLIRGGDGDGALMLLLLDASGEVLAVAHEVSGRVDLRSVLPPVKDLQRAAWLQLTRNDAPMGSPIVVQPMREPPPVRTMRDLRPGTTTEYTKVIGWGSEPLDAADAKIKDEQAKWIAGDPPILSGYKVYAEMDALIRTDHGEIRIAFAPDEAPATAWNFRTLARDGFYDDGGFHRVVPVDRQGRPFVIQGGDPTQTGNGGPGYALALEPSTLAHDYGVISMARADDPHSAGSQFFVALGREGCARLDGQYCAFGYAVAGNRTIDSIAATPIADVSEGRPATVPKILTVRLVDAPARMPGIDRRADRVTPTAPAGETSPGAR